MSTALAVLRASWGVLVEAAPWVLLGLAVAGLLRATLPPRLVGRWLGRPGLGGALRAAAIGIPLPICSCGVVPVALELRRQGASRQATTAFLVTTPESGIDSILLTWGLLGPWMALARPLVSGISSLTAALAIGRERPGDGPPEPATPQPRGAVQPPRKLLAPAGRAVIELLDEIAFWLLLGVLAAGAVSVLLGDGGMSRVVEAPAWAQTLLVLAVSVPVYLCAVAATPLAAALVAGGLAPGAALVLLLAGPATNLASLLVLGRSFGRRWVAGYLAAVVGGALAGGAAIDALAARGFFPIVSGAASVPETIAWLGPASAVVLLALSAWRLVRGAAREGWSDLTAPFRALRPAARR